jgi:hypothetical protein
MKSSSDPTRLAINIALILLSSYGLAITAVGDYRLLTRYPFGAATVSTCARFKGAPGE